MKFKGGGFNLNPLVYALASYAR